MLKNSFCISPGRMKRGSEKIASIPDDDIGGWIQSLREGGFTDQEMDEMLGALNPNYRNLRDNLKARARMRPGPKRSSRKKTAYA